MARQRARRFHVGHAAIDLDGRRAELDAAEARRGPRGSAHARLEDTSQSKSHVVMTYVIVIVT